MLFETFPTIEKITITIRKPAIIAEANAVGIRLERTETILRSLASNLDADQHFTFAYTQLATLGK
jgi:hypothetical protein